ncbi:unnamed protein product, partial [Anisakis simplex]|uniref:RING-CH-type domain-containing protein n=1 Tax=Anisakis simplex TaxID=6269 RepID=A0A0M3J5U5_ANISI
MGDLTDEADAEGDGDGNEIRVFFSCKFCYSDDDSMGKWLCPCKCTGSIKWVHSSCFDKWLQNAPIAQKTQCQTYVYKKRWELKPFEEWCVPRVKLSCWELLEILLDLYSTYGLLKGLKRTLTGQRSGLFIIYCDMSWYSQLAHFLFWKTFVATDRRIGFYKNLGRMIA